MYGRQQNDEQKDVRGPVEHPKTNCFSISVTCTAACAGSLYLRALRGACFTLVCEEADGLQIGGRVLQSNIAELVRELAL